MIIMRAAVWHQIDAVRSRIKMPPISREDKVVNRLHNSRVRTVTKVLEELSAVSLMH